MRSLDYAAACYPWSVAVDEEFRRVVGFLGLETSAERLVRASYGVALAGGALVLTLTALSPPGKRLLVSLVCGLFVLLVSVSVTAVPRLVATARRVRALGDAPGLVGRAVLRMRLSPSPERAVSFAANAGETLLAESLGRHVRRCRGTNESAVDAFAQEWEAWFPSLGRALSLVETAAVTPESEREETLERALSVVLDGTREQVQTFADSIRGPVTALYAFGVLLPTALVALLPAARTAGVGVTPLAVIIVYDLLLPAMLVAAGAWILARRPVTFPAPNVSRHHPDVPNRLGKALAGGTATALCSWVGIGAVFPPWAPPIAALGVGIGVALSLTFRPALSVYERVRTIERGLTDALSVVGQRVSRGRAVETAVEHAGETLSGEVGDVFAAAATTQRRLQVSVERAFLGDYGALAGVPSSRARSSVAFLGRAARDGRPAGPAILALADHVDELRQVEDEMRHALGTVCGTLGSTGAVFGPLVAGATVAMAEGMAAGHGSLPGATGPLPWLGLAVGWYVLALAALLPALATGLVSGLDRTLIGVRVGRSLCSATGCYLLAYLIAAAIA